MVLSYVITMVGGCFSAAEPVETHVRSFGLPKVNGIIDNFEVFCFVCLHYHWWLWMSHGDECVPDGYCFAAIDI